MTLVKRLRDRIAVLEVGLVAGADNAKDKDARIEELEAEVRLLDDELEDCCQTAKDRRDAYYNAEKVVEVARPMRRLIEGEASALKIFDEYLAAYDQAVK